MQKKTYLKNQGHGSVTSGFEGALESLVRDVNGAALGRSGERFQITPDSRGALIATNVADRGLLLKRSKCTDPNFDSA